MSNIVQQPQEYSFAGNLGDLVMTSDRAIAFAIDGLLEERYEPDASGRVVIPLRAFFEAHLHAPGLDDVPAEGLPLTTYTYSIDGEEAGSFFVLPGGVNAGSLDTPLFLKSNFLTWQPQTRYVGYHEPQWLRYVALNDCTVRVKGYFASTDDETGGDTQTITIQELTAGRVYSLDVNYGRVRRLFDRQPTYFDVWVENAEGDRQSFVQRYVLRETGDEQTADWFVFENSLGGYDTIRFTGDRKEVGESESRNAVFDGDTFEFGIDYGKAWTKYTGYLPDERTRQWVLEFFSSCRRYHLADSSLERIYVSKPKLEATAGEAAGYEFTFAYPHQSRYLNIARDELPEQLEIVGPGAELFFLTPRLNEFPILDPEGDVLIPAQYAYSGRWGVIPASALGGGTGGGGDVVTGKEPIRVDRTNRIVRISHEPPTLPDPERFNRYGNVDEWGHIIEDYHPHGGRADLDFAAQEIAGRELSLTGPIGHPEYVPGVLGSAWGGTPEGDFWFRTLGVRDGITTKEIVYNRQSVEGNIKYFTDGIAVDRVSDTARLVDNAGRPLRTQHDVQLVTSIGPGMYHIVQKSYDGDDRVPFRPDDLLVGYFRHDGVLPTATYLRVVSVFGPGEGFTARLVQGAPPQRHMVLARRGNYSDPARQNSVYVDGKSGKMVFLRGVNDTALRPYNTAAQIGYIGDVVDGDFPDIAPEEVGLYTQNIRAKGDFVLRNGKDVATEFSVTAGRIESAVSSIETLDGRVTQEVSQLTQTASDISLSVGSLSESLNGRIDMAESRITLNAQGIEQKVGLNGVISAINQSAEEVKIEANRIRLIGETTLDGIVNLNGTVKAEYIDVENLIVRKLRTKDSGTRIEIDDQTQQIRAVDYRDREVFELSGFNWNELPSMAFYDEYDGDYSRMTKNGFYVCKGSGNPYVSATAILTDRFVIVKLPGGEDMGKMGCADGLAFLQLKAPKTLVTFSGLQSKSGVDGNWKPLYIDIDTGDVRTA